MTTHFDAEDGFNSEVYLSTRDLTPEEVAAIKVLTGVNMDPPTDNSEEDAGDDADWNYPLAFFIVNALMFDARPPLDFDDEETVSDLDTFALYLQDAMQLMTKQTDPSAFAQVIAAMAVSAQVEDWQRVEDAEGAPTRWQQYLADADRFRVERLVSPKNS
ncbi:hypothetical protein [Mangrovicoccus algicola]|uniref:Uncharacterized protein n=1 Tax=Mangrovicoccus algicola TaxID=2771008 RepID=A0A8J6Z984_9RHOB|nr:hypothetical protein [Mangrovicoccus algicola]MBE3640344.1 hypothetical protein [Mangrovicoccus algicola]